MSVERYNLILKACVVLFLLTMFFFGNAALIAVTYVFVFVFVTIRAIGIHSKKRMKFQMLVAYVFLLFLQLQLNSIVSAQTGRNEFVLYFGKVIIVLFILVPFMTEKFVLVNKYASFYFPSVAEISIISFYELKNNVGSFFSVFSEIKKAGAKVTPEKIEEIITDIPRHNAFKYINNGTLTQSYFDTAYGSLNDPHIYIVISNTGSPASEVISIFTKKQYNHASLAFDYDLKTIISYNGGEKVYPPGLNHEIVSYFNKKPDSSIIVYKLETTSEQKKIIIDKVNEINNEGSAYNVMGLFVKYSHKSNIMFCSQFVYKMLEYANLQYFKADSKAVIPTDLVELDYHRKLQFAYEIKLNNN